MTNQSEQLDRIAAILLLAFSDQLSSARERLREDPTTAAIFDRTEEWVPSAVLQRDVASATSVTERTVRNRLSELRSRGLLMATGAGTQTQYKSAGVV